MDERERGVVEDIAERRDELVALASDLIRFDTVARAPEDPGGPAAEAALQGYLAGRLADAGLEVEVWEPDPSALSGHPQIPPGLHFGGRPQLLARRPGTGGGRTLLLNGHIDVVPALGADGWTSDPFAPEVRDGRLYGRGACDMKGGVAAMVFAVEALARLGIPTAGDVLVNTVTDEESTGAGALATAARGVRADAGIVPEPTSLDLWTACRGSVLAAVTVRGRAGHAGLSRPGGGNRAVNAIDKAALLLAALRGLREEWERREGQTHPLLGAGDIVPTAISAGGWLVAHPPECRFELHVSYLPAQADPDGWSEGVRGELVERLAAAAVADPWLREHPPEIAWVPGGVPPAEVPAEEPVVALAREVATEVGRPGRLANRTTWHDGATFTRAGIPMIGFGPGSVTDAHAADEHVEIDELVTSAQSLALAALRFCGVPTGS